MKKNTFNSFAFGCVITLILTLLITTLIQNKNIIKTEDITDLNTISTLIDKYYYGDFTNSEIVDGILSGACYNLDSYSTFLSKEDFSSFSTVEQNKYGVGIKYTYNKYDKTFTVIGVYKDSPASVSGIMKNDKIVAIDGIDTYNMNGDKFSECIKGDLDSEVELKVLRDDEFLDFTLIRENMYFPLVYHESLNNDTLYINISSFTGNVVDDFNSVLFKYPDSSNLVIDLRDNIGGELDLMLKILGVVIPNTDIGYIQYKDRQEKLVVSGLDSNNYNIVVLVNENTASCAETFALAIKEYGYGKIIGVETYGKNEVQRVFSIDKDKYLKLTVGKIIINNKDINGVGLTPNYIIEYEYLGDDFQEDNLLMDNQVQLAVKVLNMGRI